MAYYCRRHRYGCSLLLLLLRLLTAASSFQWNKNPFFRHHIMNIEPHHHQKHHPHEVVVVASPIAAVSSNNIDSSSLMKKSSRWTSSSLLTTLSANTNTRRRGGRARGVNTYLLASSSMGEEDGEVEEEEDDTELLYDASKSMTAPKPPPSRTPKSASLMGAIDDSPTQQVAMSMKDVDEALNDEIMGALRSAEQDLMESQLVVDGGGGDPNDSDIRSTAGGVVPVPKEDEERMLLQSLQEAQREADEAEEMLRQAEEEAAKWEKELAQLEEEAARNSMAEAYQAALEAANDNVDTLSSQIQGLESELASTLRKMEQSIEDKERISAEYAFLAKNYGELKNQQSQGSTTTSLLEEEIATYRSQISELELQVKNVGLSLSTAQEEATKWQTMYNDIQSSMEANITSQLQSTVDAYELKVLEVTATLEEEKASIQQDANTVIDQLQSEFNAGILKNQRMISALRQSLRKTRKEKSYLEEKSSVERTKAVEDVRERMNSEVANLKEVLKSIEGEMGEKEKVMQSVMDGKEETEKLMEEIRYVYSFVHFLAHSLYSSLRTIYSNGNSLHSIILSIHTQNSPPSI
jgi:hypothetical protein